MTLANSKLSILGLFTKLLQEPLGKCARCEHRKLVIIDALDETEYESRDDFLDLVMHRFPLLPKWLLFFITSRPEDTVQFTLKNYNPCIQICIGSSKHLNVYQQQEQDIKRFLEKKVDFSSLPFIVEDVTKKCNGLFLYAFYMVEVLNNLVLSGNIDELTDLFPGDIDVFFRDNFKRIFDKVGAHLFKTLFGCVVASPSPLPRSFISFILKREKSNLDEQEVIDTVSIFLVLRASDQTFTFLHSLIPSWLTNSSKARRFFLDTSKAGEYLKEIVLEFLPSVINVSSEKHSSVETDLLNYVLCVGVRVLCGCHDKNSMKVVYNCLSSYQFIQKRIQNSRIEVYSVIGDLKLSSRCQTLNDTEKQILQEVCRALERNIHTLLECPHLLPSCVQTASRAVRTNMAIPDGVSTTWMEWSWLSYPAPKATPSKVKNCFALSPDKKLLAEVKDGCISLHNSYSLERLLGPVENEELADIKHLVFSSCGKFVFFGRCNRAFSVDRGRIERYHLFRIVNLSWEWCSFALDRQHIVVKSEYLLTDTCCLCLLNHLCSWAKMEIARSRESEPSCRCFPRKLNVTRKLPQLEKYQGSCITAMRPLLNLLSEMQCEEWCLLLEKVQLNRGDASFLVRGCHRCKSSREYEALALEEVRQFIIDHYSEIFKYQVWDVRTGEPVFNLALSSDAEVSPFVHFCHLGTALKICGTLFTGIDKALSLSSVALLSTICHHLLFLERRSTEHPPSHSLRHDRHIFRVDAGRLSSFPLSCHVKRDIRYVEDCILFDETCSSVLYLTRCGEPFSTFTLTDLSNDDTYEAIEQASALSTVSPTIVSEVENLPDEGKKAFLSGNLPCLSPEVTWVAKPFVVDSETTVYLLRGRHPYQQQQSNNPEYVIKEVAQFSFTNDHSFFVYLSVHNSLHILLSFQSGTILQSISRVNPLFFIPEGQAGYHFQADDEEETLFLKDFSCDFLQHFLIPSVKKPMQANFVSVDTFLVHCADLSVMTFRATSDRCTNTLVSERSLDFGSLRPRQVEKCAFSSDGKLIAVHHGTKITLHNTIGPDDCRFLCSVFEADYEFSVTQLTFSADSALLLFCILRGRNCPFVYVWDVDKKVISVSFDSPGLLSEDFCTCFTLDNKIVLCSELYIEIWEHVASPCHVLTRLAIDVLYSEADKITYCTVSPRNDLLACCIVDRILVYSLANHTFQPVLKLPRAHLGKIEFCLSLKGNRYIISYSIDGAVFLWDLPEQRAISFIRIPQEHENITFMTVSPKEDKVVGGTSFGRIFAIKICRLTFELPLLQLQPQEMTRVHNASTLPGAVCSNVEQIAENTDTSKLVEEMDFMFSSNRSDDSVGDESENSEADQ